MTTLVVRAGAGCADCGGAVGQGICTDARITLLYIGANYDAYITVNGNVAALPRTPDGALQAAKQLGQLPRMPRSSRQLNVRLALSSPQCVIAYVSMP